VSSSAELAPRDLGEILSQTFRIKEGYNLGEMATEIGTQPGESVA